MLKIYQRNSENKVKVIADKLNTNELRKNTLLAVLVCIFSVMKLNIFLIDVFNGKISSAKCPSFFCCNLGKYFYSFILYHNCL